jgi:hypothetical protein
MGGSGQAPDRSSSSSADARCVPTPTRRGPPPAWTAAAWSDSSPGFAVPYALTSNDAAGAFFFANPLRAGHPTNPSNKVLWIVRVSGRNGAENGAKPFSFANMPSEHRAILTFVARVSIGSEEWQRAWRRESRLLVRVRRASWRREMAELERTWAIASAHAEGVSLRKIAAAAGLGATRVHAIVRDADLDSLDAALGELRSLYGWPAPEDRDGSRDDELAGRELIAGPT